MRAGKDHSGEKNKRNGNIFLIDNGYLMIIMILFKDWLRMQTRRKEGRTNKQVIKGGIIKYHGKKFIKGIDINQKKLHYNLA